MNIFNSLGSNYNLQYIANSIYLQDKNGRKNLKLFLENVFQKHALLFYKGREAITQSIVEMQLPEGSKIAVNGFTCVAVVDAIKNAKCTPVFIDIDPETLHFTAEKLEQKIKHSHIKAVIIQNTLGFPCDIESIQKICKKENALLIEDLAHSVGCVYDNQKPAGSIGEYAILSFSQDKVIDAVSGGALLSTHPYKNFKSSNYKKADASFQDKMYPFFTYVIKRTYKIGIGKVLHAALKHSRMLSNPMKHDTFKALSDWHATLALQELQTIDENLSHRRSISKIYADLLKSDLQFKSLSKKINTSTCLRFPIKISRRSEFMEYAKAQGLYISDTWYDTPIAPKKYLEKSGYKIGECPESEKVSKHILNLPTHIQVTQQDAYTISELINSWHTKHKS